jgi:Na+/melibiose symporter-like transporter
MQEISELEAFTSNAQGYVDRTILEQNKVESFPEIHTQTLKPYNWKTFWEIFVICLFGIGITSIILCFLVPRASENDEDANKDPETSKNFLLVMLLVIIVITGTSYLNVVSLVPIFMKENHSMFKETAIGILLSAYHFGFLLAAPVIGELAPKIGRKNLIVIGVSMVCLGTLLFALGGLVENSAGFYAISMIGRLI